MCYIFIVPPNTQPTQTRMAAAREKLKTHRRKTAQKHVANVKLLEPTDVRTEEASMIVEKIRVPTKSRSALIPGEGRSMAMDMS
jgi:large subunit ribosomal protein L24e